jgi:hypothetical protein
MRQTTASTDTDTHWKKSGTSQHRTGFANVGEEIPWLPDNESRKVAKRYAFPEKEKGAAGSNYNKLLILVSLKLRIFRVKSHKIA